ncbi:hypothetical protein [Pseudoroseomonas cervicalis]|uniref:hypothetical protein n=1 Tax=Teichococcus cervicalis TaxID=204525 RepID=UPI00277D2508|nr:hypothetical protein [Pseudoroseomonas cervicalis]MDQ1080995.1 hypothetical protein [Pseudoroseomonas cervicalis]
MSEAELQCLALALRQDSALRATLGAALAPCRTAAEASAVLQRHGYAIEAAALQTSGTALSDTALDGVAGGGLFDILSSVASKAVPFLKGGLGSVTP